MKKQAIILNNICLFFILYSTCANPNN